MRGDVMRLYVCKKCHEVVSARTRNVFDRSPTRRPRPRCSLCGSRALAFWGEPALSSDPCPVCGEPEVGDYRICAGCGFDPVLYGELNTTGPCPRCGEPVTAEETGCVD